MKRITFLSYTLFIFLGLFSCKASKKASTDVAKESEVESVVSALEAQSFHPTWFKAKAKLQSKINGRGMSFSSTIVSKDKELLWLNGKMFGIEGARIKVTPDSIFALNRLKKEYLEERMDWVAREYDLPSILAEAIDLEHMQDIFIGNPILDVIPLTEIVPKESDYLLTGMESNYLTELMVNSSTMHTKYFYLSQGDSKLTVEYSDYRLVDEKHAIAHRRDITIQRPDEDDINVSILYDNVTIDEEQSVKFSIPGSYSKM